MNTSRMWIAGLMAAVAVLMTPLVGQGVVVDLASSSGLSGTANGGSFVWVDQSSTGTGVIDPFVRIQGSGTEEGYNTDQSDVYADTKTGLWTHDITLGEIPIVNYNGVDSYEFLLDINEDKGSDHELLSLYEIEIYLSATALTSADEYSDLPGPAVWDLDSGADGDSTIELNFILNPGSGAGDMFMYIPVTTLGTDGSQYLYLYSAFGSPNSSSDGFEEWAVRVAEPPTSVPDGGVTAAMLGMALVAAGGLKRLFRG